MRSDPVVILSCAAFALLAVATGAPDLIDYDSTQFALALDQHDLRFHQPQPPGFVLFVSLARFVKGFVGDAYLSLRIVAIALLIAAAIFLGKLALDAYDRTTARLAVGLFLSSPLVLFHGMTTMVYPAEALIAAMVGYYAHRAVRGSERDLRLLAFLVGVLAGVRQTALVFSIPLLILVARRGTFGRHAFDRATLAWCLGVLAWLLPQLRVSGGFDGYLRANLLLQSHLFAESPLHEGMPPLEDHLRRGMNVLLMGLGIFRLILLAFNRRSRAIRSASPAERQPGNLDPGFYAAWLLPPVLLLVLYHFPKSGYALAVWPGLILAMAHLLRSGKLFVSSPRVKVTAIATVLALDVLLFFFLPIAHIGKEPWDLPQLTAAEQGVRSLPGFHWWRDIDSAPGILRRPAKLLFGRVDFFFDRTRGFKFGGFLAALREAGFPREDTLLIGQDATRVACYGLPQQSLVHVDPVRPEPFLAYRGRRARRIGDSFVLPPEIRWLLIEGPADSLQFTSSARPWSRQSLGGPLAGHFQLLEIGDGTVRAAFTPRRVAGIPPVELQLIRDSGSTDDARTSSVRD